MPLPNHIVKNPLFVLFAAVCLPSGTVTAQCSIESSCGYTVNVSTKILNVVPSTNSCPYGYNYNLRFSYNIEIRGINTCYNGDIGFQPQFICNNQNNGYYTINLQAPSVGSANGTASYSGTLVTSTNPFTGATDCATVTPTSMNCNHMQVTIYGPGLPTTTYPCSFSILPIELLGFSGSFGKNGVLLKWATAMEKNNSFFTVERSADGLAWEVAGQVNGAGNSISRRQYELTDRDFTPGILYYRLKQTDNDGSSRYSEIIFVNAKSGEGNIRYYPNPVKDALTLETGTSLALPFSLSNSLGQQLMGGSVEKTGTLPMETLQPGMYLLRIGNGTMAQHFKVLKD